MRKLIFLLVLFAALAGCRSQQQKEPVKRAAPKPKQTPVEENDPDKIRLKHEQNQVLVDMQLQSIIRKIDIYFYENGNCPRNLVALTYCNPALHKSCSWQVPEEKLTDPWGREVLYVRDQMGTSCEVKSLGADGENGGAGINRDTVHRGPTIETRKWDLGRDSKYR